MTDARRVIKRVRKVGILQVPLRDPYGAWLEKQRVSNMWERDKEIKRDQNFQKMTLAREKQVAAIRAEKERQELINEERLKNLKKARRAKKRRNR